MFKGWPKLHWFITEHLARPPKEWQPPPRLNDDTPAYVEVRHRGWWGGGRGWEGWQDGMEQFTGCQARMGAKGPRCRALKHKQKTDFTLVVRLVSRLVLRLIRKRLGKRVEWMALLVYNEIHVSRLAQNGKYYTLCTMTVHWIQKAGANRLANANRRQMEPFRKRVITMVTRFCF